MFARALSDSYMAAWIHAAKSIAEQHETIRDRDIVPTPETPAIRSASSHDEPQVQWEFTQRGAAWLEGKQVLTREDFDRLSQAAQQRAFTVADITTEEDVARVQELLGEAIAEGGSLEAFQRTLDEDLDGNPLSPARMEQVFRDGVNTAYTAGANELLESTDIGDAYPYRAYFPIHDARCREEHRKLETLGLNGTNVYRGDDPVWREFCPPWAWNCRCAWVALDKEQAAERGVKEAKEWVRTGIPPATPEWVEHPPFVAPPEYQRATVMAAEFREEDHPRAADGRFGDKSGTHAKAMPKDWTGRVDLVDKGTGEVLHTADAAEVRAMLADAVASGDTLDGVMVRQSSTEADAAESRRKADAEAAREARVKEAQRQEALRTGYGLKPGHKDFVAPPERLYHATFAGDQIASEGFKSADEVGKQTLGGTSGHLVSFTTEENAKLYMDGLNAARSAARGEMDESELTKTGERFGVSSEQMGQILSHYSKGSPSKRAFDVLQAVAMRGKKFPLFMGSDWPDHLATSDPATVVSVPSAGVEDIYYNPSEKEWRVADYKNLKLRDVKREGK